MKIELEEVECPLCGSDKKERLIPSAKRTDDQGQFRVSDKIYLSCCGNCGCVFEFPRIKPSSDGDFSKNAYYNYDNPAWWHDNSVQYPMAQYNWDALKDRLPWNEFSSVMDVGAAGAWSELVRRKVPNVSRSVLVEPGPLGVFNCEVRYPEVETYLGVFEEYEELENSFDAISFFSSFYSISNPIGTLSKVNTMLKQGGYLILCLSQVSMEVAYWTKDGPYINTSHLVRGVLQIYYSRKSIAQLLDICGFEVVDDFIYELPVWHRLEDKERQMNFIVAKRVREPETNTDITRFENPDEVNWAHSFYKDYTKIASRKSIKLFFDRHTVEKITLVHDTSEEYLDWICEEISAYLSDVDVHKVSEDNYSDVYALEDVKGHHILVVGDHDVLEDLPSRYSETQIFFASPPHAYDGYGDCIRHPDTKEVIITRAFCPDYRDGDDIFFFDRRPAVNDKIVSQEEFGWIEREDFYLSRRYNIYAEIGHKLAVFCVDNWEEEAKLFLSRLQEIVDAGPKIGCPIDDVGVQHFSTPHLDCFSETDRNKRISVIRKLFQWAALYSLNSEADQILSEAKKIANLS